MSQNATKHICFLVDSQASSAKREHLQTSISNLKNKYTVDFLHEDYTENETLVRMQSQTYELIFIPWHKYISWPRIDASMGLDRSEGPLVVGYFSFSNTGAIEIPSSHQRAVFLGLGDLEPNQLDSLISNLTHDKRRSGLLPLLRIDGSHYFASLTPDTPMFQVSQWVQNIPEILDWKGRWLDIFSSLMSLWELRQRSHAHFEVAVDEANLFFRVCMPLDGRSNKEIVAQFWRNPELPNSPESNLAYHSDFLRVHPVSQLNELEVTLGFLHTTPTQPQCYHGNLWIEPMSKENYVGSPLSGSNKHASSMINLESLKISTKNHPPPSEQTPSSSTYELTNKIRELEETLLELRQGGVSHSTPSTFGPADPVSLLDRVEEQFVDSLHQISKLSSDQDEGLISAKDRPAVDLQLHRTRKEITKGLERLEEAYSRIKNLIKTKGNKKIG